MAHAARDDGFHEIQLNGKQLVFLFMAATVVSVVIFLCGVLVGRGVRAERASAAEATSAESLSAELTPAALAVDPPALAESDPTKAAPPPEVNDLSYFKRLEGQNEPAENLKPAAARESATTPVSKQAPPAPATPPPQAKPADTRMAKSSPPQSAAPAATPGPPPGGGYAVQVAALNVRGEADAIAKRLVDKGYAAYVVAPPNGSASVFRVRVGSFKTRREAETIATKLQKEEQFKPWITR